MGTSNNLSRARLGAAMLSAMALTACGDRTPNEAPPRGTDTIVIQPQASTIAVPIEADITRLEKALEAQIPKELWAIDKPNQVCAPSEQVKVLFVKMKTPTITCHIVGKVTRGQIALSGAGRTLTLSIPVRAVVHARDIGGVLKQETATANAQVQARLQIDLASDWTPQGKVDLAYRWTSPPTIEFLGQKIDLSEQADAKLKGVIANLERSLPGELAALHIRQKAQLAWNTAFTSLQLNRERPPVWMRISPQELQYGGYEIANNRIILRLGMRAVTETFVGERPADTKPTALPPLKRLEGEAKKLTFFIPVIADYRELEPVLMRALTKRAAHPFEVPGVGPVFAQFHKVTIYGSTEGRIAVGLNFSASDKANTIGKTRATVWMTAVPNNQPNSRQVSFSQFAVSGSTDRTGGDLVIKMANAPGLSDTIALALVQNFENDYGKLMRKVDRAIEEKREGDFIIRASIDDVRTGTLKSSGRGLYLPVEATGTASITLSPQ